MLIRGPALILSARGHGEHGAVVRLFAPGDGVQAGYVPGGRSRRLRPALLPGNLVVAELRARVATQLAAATIELVRSRSPLLAEPLAAAAIEWLTALTATALPEGQGYSRLYNALAAVLDAMEAAPSARIWAAALIRYELLLLAELGFGLDLTACAGGGDADDLAWVSPKSGAAVSRIAGAPYADRLLPLPGFLLAGGEADWPDLVAAARLTGHFIVRDLLTGREAGVLAARERLVARMLRLA